MMRTLIVGVAALFIAGSAQAQNITLTHEAGSAGGASDVSAKNLAEVAAAGKIATIQVQVGKTLTKSMLQVAEGKTDISASPFILKFLMSRGLGPYSGVGKEKGKKLANNLRLLYPYHIASYYLIAFQSTGIDSFAKLKGKTIHNGPPRGGALVTARQIIQLTTGFKEGRDYTGKQIAWGQAHSIFLDRSVDAAFRPGTNPSAFMPIFMAAGKLNLVSLPKAKFESKGFQKYLKAPGNVANVFPVGDLAHYGPKVRVVSEDGMFRTLANSAGDMVHKNMDKKLAKALTAAYIKSIPNLFRKVPFARSSQFGQVADKKMGLCKPGILYHRGAFEAWEEAGYKLPACSKPPG
ncbi:MAG: TAXI family TRAP transporter solute-binding subunit [Rhodospirillales bacterium]|jgi:hypothetical protein|nr:TAXI family TRAP transporter solute-binding subunit [Rhodospirillales bacterium]MDP6643484.1 TAXI family TRAP transporter solute-binding subunit [Rhodospirillales bacterium]MDP6842576.1 TAXI family TRAP transporter solute-binding subunit [Rhodospirillales bacterium]